MLRAAIVTSWTGSGRAGDPYRPLAGDLYGLQSWTDVTGQDARYLPPAPNALVIEVECAPEVLAQMDADGVPILWAEEVEDASGGG